MFLQMFSDNMTHMCIFAQGYTAEGREGEYLPQISHKYILRSVRYQIRMTGKFLSAVQAVGAVDCQR